MRRKYGFQIIFLVASLMCGVLAAEAKTDPGIEGNYVEVRSCDIFTGRCFMNGEVGLMGSEATLAWEVTEGSWEGVGLDGLKVIAIVKAKNTLGYKSGDAYPAKSVVVVDEEATKVQRDALVSFAKSMGGALLEDVVHVEAAPISFSVNDCSEDQCASVKAGSLVAVDARRIVRKDLICGREKALFPPLTDVLDPRPHFTSRDMFRGTGLGMTWDDGGGRSVYLAKFAR